MRRAILITFLALSSTAYSGAAPATKPSTRPIYRYVKPKPTVTPAYVKSTPAQDAAAIDDARHRKDEVEKSLGLKFVEIQTPHFLIFTDWQTAEHPFLRENLEGAYTVVSKQFEISPRENIFIGKLPVYMFDKRKDFNKFAEAYDELTLPPGVAGYYGARSDGMGHLAMWKPDYRGSDEKARQAVKRWGYTLTHEFTHAFVARYRSNTFIPTWLNEGIAEVIASSQFPNPDARREAHDIAEQTKSISDLFEEDGFKGAESYPIMRTLVETMLRRNRKIFKSYFDSIKDGTDPEEALKKFYGWSYTDLEKAWRQELTLRPY